jgi:DNA methyltransferase 1-associated protein 1
VDTWIQYKFLNPARSDTAFLEHWTKEKEKDEQYPFAKFNKHIEVLSYTEEEYKNAVNPLPQDPRK